LTRDLRPLFDPASVAVLGASADPSKWGNTLARGALRGESRRRVFLVNRSGGEILGRAAYPSLADLPEAPELVVVSVPAAGFAEAVDRSLDAGAKAIVAISAGLGEAGAEGRRLEDAVVERVRAAGAVMLGPNCLGVFDAGAELDLGWSALPAGPVGLISQSGNLALELARLAAPAGLGFSRFASLGNQADLVASDLLDELATHDETRVIALYLEDFRDGRAFVAAAARARELGKPVVLLTGGVTQASARAALSHTGALVSDARSVEAACRAAGIVDVATPKQLVDAAQALLSGRTPRGRRVAVYCDGGGHGVVAADVLAAAGLDVPALSAVTTAALAKELPSTASLANPVDFAGGGERGLAAYADVGRILLGADDVDAVLLTGYFGGYGVDTPELEAEEVEAAHDLGGPRRRPAARSSSTRRTPSPRPRRRSAPAACRSTATSSRPSRRWRCSPAGTSRPGGSPPTRARSTRSRRRRPATRPRGRSSQPQGCPYRRRARRRRSRRPWRPATSSAIPSC
jgi:acyl-CoA synthetase (NDP forming)